MLSVPMPGMFVDPHRMREALEARAEAYVLVVPILAGLVGHNFAKAAPTCSVT